MITISKQEITSYQGEQIALFRITNSPGAYAEVINYGATLVSIVIPDKSDRLSNVILRYKNIEDYFTDNAYLGSTVGRVANRISNAQFTLNEQIYHLDKNDGKHINHGGFNGFSKKIFDYSIHDNSVVFSLKSHDGECGFPGEISFSVTYSFNDKNELQIGYQAVSNKLTPFNPTNHAYFNFLFHEENILNHELRIYADTYLESTDEFIPTGRILSVKDTAFDFRQYRTFNEMLPLKKEIIKGYNTYFISSDTTNKLKKLASLKEENSSRQMDMYSTMPGCMIYTGDYLSGSHIPFGGVCLEAQYHPDGLNHNFPANLLYPGKEAKEVIKYCFL